MWMSRYPTSPARRRSAGDEGIVIVLIAMAMVAILIMAALVLDLSNVRNTRQGDKLIADTAAAAGLRDLAPDGTALPWRGACSALNFLKANGAGSSLSVNFFDGDGPSGPALSDQCGNTVECDPSNKSTWAWITASFGSFRADIRTAYVTPDPTYPDDAGSYNLDDGDPTRGGCDQLAVIISNSDGTLFGGVAGATGYATGTRTVGRVLLGPDAPAAVALVLLEQTDCETLDYSGSGSILVRGTEGRQGIIHADSSGEPAECGSSDVVIEGNNTTSSGPQVRALSAPSDPTVHGIITTYAGFLGRSNGASWTSTRVSASTEVWTCDPDSGSAGPSTCSDGPTGARRVTRQPADERYLAKVTDLRGEEMAPIFASLAAGSIPSGYEAFTAAGGTCNPGGASTQTVGLAAGPGVTVVVPSGKLYIDCPNNSGPSSFTIGTNQQVILESGITEVVIDNTLGLAGNGVLDMRNVRKVTIYNRQSAATAVSSGANLLVNLNGYEDCAARQVANSAEVTEVVVRTGQVTTTGGGSIRLCSTFVHLMGGSTTSDPRVSACTYPVPCVNPSNNGAISVGGSGTFEWTAPNTEDALPNVGSYRFEDLALWTESQCLATSASPASGLGGGGVIRMRGIYFLPNCGPTAGAGGFYVSGSSSGSIDFNAQLWTRKLRINGGPPFAMKANPDDSIPVDRFLGSGLVR